MKKQDEIDNLKKVIADAEKVISDIDGIKGLNGNNLHRSRQVKLQSEKLIKDTSILLSNIERDRSPFGEKEWSGPEDWNFNRSIGNVKLIFNNGPMFDDGDEGEEEGDLPW